MATVWCKNCTRRLDVDEHVTGLWLTCPYCLASVMNPNDVGSGPRHQPDVPTRDAAIAAGPPPATPARQTCPACRADVQAGWRLCPLCGVSLIRSGNPPHRSSFDAEVSRDQRATLSVLSILGFLGLALVAGMAVTMGGGGCFVPIVLTVGILLLISFGVTAAQHAGTSRDVSGGEITGKSLQLAGKILFFVVATVIAGAIFFFVTCAIMLSNMRLNFGPN